MKLIKLFLIIIFLWLWLPLAAFSQENTATAEPSLTEKIKERLQDTAEEGLVAIKEQLTAKSNTPRRKAYIGKIAQVNEEQLTVNYKEQNLNVDLAPSAEFVKGASTVIDADDLKPGDFVIAMGFYYPGEEKFTAVRVSVIREPEPAAKRQLIQGKISEVDGQKISFDGRNLTTSAKTKLQISGLDEPENDDISLGDYLFALVTLDSNGDIDTVGNVFVLPGRRNPASLVPTNRPNATASGDAQE